MQIFWCYNGCQDWKLLIYFSAIQIKLHQPIMHAVWTYQLLNAEREMLLINSLILG